MTNKLWIKFFKRKREKTWKTDCYFGTVGNEKFRGHMSISGATIVGNKIIYGEIYYLRDICGNVLINMNESGKRLL